METCVSRALHTLFAACRGYGTVGQRSPDRIHHRGRHPLHPADARHGEPRVRRRRADGTPEALEPFLLGQGLAASGGVVSGRAVFSIPAIDAIRRAHPGDKVILVRPETNPEDVVGMEKSDGILTCIGGMTSHAVLQMRRLEKCGVSDFSLMSIDEEKTRRRSTRPIPGAGPWSSGRGTSSPSTATRATSSRVSTGPGEGNVERVRVNAWTHAETRRRGEGRMLEGIAGCHHEEAAGRRGDPYHRILSDCVRDRHAPCGRSR